MKFQNDTKTKSTRRSILPLNGKDDISKVRSLLADQPRNLLLFDMAVETGVFMKDLLQLQAKHVQSLVVGDELPVGGGSGGNPVISEQIHQTLQYYLREIHPQSADYIFIWFFALEARRKLLLHWPQVSLTEARSKTK